MSRRLKTASWPPGREPTEPIHHRRNTETIPCQPMKYQVGRHRPIRHTDDELARLPFRIKVLPKHPMRQRLDKIARVIGERKALGACERQHDDDETGKNIRLIRPEERQRRFGIAEEYEQSPADRPPHESGARELIIHVLRLIDSVRRRDDCARLRLTKLLILHQIIILIEMLIHRLLYDSRRRILHRQIERRPKLYSPI